jgi:hypothetical protein
MTTHSNGIDLILQRRQQQRQLENDNDADDLLLHHHQRRHQIGHQNGTNNQNHDDDSANIAKDWQKLQQEVAQFTADVLPFDVVFAEDNRRTLIQQREQANTNLRNSERGMNEMERPFSSSTSPPLMIGALQSMQNAALLLSSSQENNHLLETLLKQLTTVSLFDDGVRLLRAMKDAAIDRPALARLIHLLQNRLLLSTDTQQRQLPPLRALWFLSDAGLMATSFKHYADELASKDRIKFANAIKSFFIDDRERFLAMVRVLLDSFLNQKQER